MNFTSVRRHWLHIYPLTFMAVTLLSSSAATWGQQPTSLEEVVERLDRVNDDVLGQESLQNRIRAATWRMLAGDLTSDPAIGMYSSSYDSLGRSIAELSDLVKEIEGDDTLAEKLAAEPTLAMRFDVAITRLADAQEKRALSRQAELARLSQLRQIASEYRSLIETLLAGQAEVLTGNHNGMTDSAEKVDDGLTRLQDIVSQRRDYYLFDEESNVEGPASELQIISKLAVPYSAEVTRHHHAIVGLTAYRLAMEEHPANSELLSLASSRADLALADSATPVVIALATKGMVELELGRQVTAVDPFSESQHEEASKHYIQSETLISSALESLPAGNQLSGLREELGRLQNEASQPLSFVRAAAEARGIGNSPQAELILERGLQRHWNADIALALLRLKWSMGKMSWEQVDSVLASLVTSGLIGESANERLALAGHVGTLGVWKELMIDPLGNSVIVSSPDVLQRVRRAVNDLATLEAADANGKWSVRGYRTLGAALLLLLAPDSSEEEARIALEQSAIVAGELENTVSEGTGNPLAALEALYATRLGEGYLCLRLLPDYDDRAKLAFAAAMDAAAAMSKWQSAPQINGMAVLQSVLQRDDAELSRTLQEERQLRQSLQRVIPALLGSMYGEYEESPRMLSAELTSLSQPVAFSPSAQLEPRAVQTAREAVIADTRAVSSMALVKGERGIAAFKSLFDFEPNDFATLDISSIEPKVRGVKEPLLAYAMGATLEQCALHNCPAGQNRRELLKLALQSVQMATNQLDSVSSWQSRWPELPQLCDDLLGRLSGPEYFVIEARRLRSEARFLQANKVLGDAYARFESSPEIARELAAGYLDQAKLDVSTRSENLKKCLEIASAEQFTDNHAILFILGEAQEQSGRYEEALATYRRLAALSTDERDRIRVSSRIVAVRVQLISP